MNKELLLIVDAVANEKAVPRAVIFDALEQALAGAKRRQLAPVDASVRVQIDRNTGEYAAFRRWEVVADDAIIESPDRQVRLMDALDDDPQAEVGDTLEERVEPPALGRVAAQTAKQIIHARVREGERSIVREAWAGREGEMVMGQVKRYAHNQAYLDLGQGAEGVISRTMLIPGERLRVGDRVRAVLVAVDANAKGPQLILSRTSPELVRELMRLEVPEIGQGVVEIMGCARDAGQRAKVAVRALDKRTDPIGACIGMRGARVQAVMNELSGERIDLVLWHEEPAQFVVAAMAPGQVEKLVVDEPAGRMDVGVSEARLAVAIGRGGQNVRLASQLTGWTLDVMSTQALDDKRIAERRAASVLLQGALEVDEEIGDILAFHGFDTVESVAWSPMGDLLAIDEFDDEIVEVLMARAKDALLAQALTNETTDIDGSLVEAAGELAGALVEAGVATGEALAELSVDELVALHVKGVTAANAGDLILAARQPWFEAA